MSSKKRIRLDDYLVESGAFAEAGDALRAVIAGEVLVDDVVAASSAMLIDGDAAVRVRERKRFVSRGGMKLQGALEAFSLDVSGMRCLDIGASSGGFTDCLLQNGAAHVSCVDVNYGQLDWKVRDDARVEVHERMNIKDADPYAIGYPFDLIAIDVSFIGLSSLAPVLTSLSSPGSRLLALVKPQFESKRGEAPNGVVEDEAVRARTVEEVSDALKQEGFDVEGVIESQIKGHSGNVEYLLLARFAG